MLPMYNLFAFSKVSSFLVKDSVIIQIIWFCCYKK